MAAPTPAPLLPDRAFVVQLREATPLAADSLQGRIEHVTSGKASNFASFDEVLAFMRRVLDETARQDQ